MITPDVNIQRDESLKAFEINITRDDGETDAVKVLVYDDYHVEVKQWTQEELGETLKEGIIAAVKDVYERGVFDERNGG